MRHIQVKRTANPLVVNATGKTIQDLIDETIENEEMKKESESEEKSKVGEYVDAADGIADTIIKIFDKIVSPIFGWKNGGGGSYTIQSEKDNTLTYLLIGAVVVVLIVLLMRTKN